MNSKEWHRDRINELESQRTKKLIKDNRNHTTNIALLSATIVLLIFELQKEQKSVLWLVILFFCFIILLGVITMEHKDYEEDKLIQRNYNALLGREKF